MFDTQTMKSSDEGVSPVIGVILMVAITVILAAVIGTFVLDLAGNLEQSATASVTFDEDSTNDNVRVQIVSMQNADFVEVRTDQGSLSAHNGATPAWDTGGSYTDSGGTTGNNQVDLNSVGSTATFDYGSGNSGTLTAVGYLEGSGSVLQTYSYGG